MAEERRRRAYDDTTVKDVKGVNEDFVLHVPAGRPLREAVDYLAEHKIGLTLVISSDGALAGVISERDVVRALYEHGNHALNMPVDMFMVRDVLTCSDRDKVEDVAKLMAEKHIRHLPIVEDGYLAGMISATDLVRHFASKA
ncbi:MAG: CBS domain-containing protein [Rhodospirillales bacterium]|nr:CBS domain-containing protein [Rhodospirillales bacterium]